MTVLQVLTDTDFQTTPLIDITGVKFLAGGSDEGDYTFAIFSSEQVSNALSPDLLVTGSIGNNEIIVEGGSVDLSGWRLENWSRADRCTFYGSSAADTMIGSQGYDWMNVGSGDTADGMGGNDVIMSFGSTTVNGGAGSDIIYDFLGHNTINGGRDNDELRISTPSKFAPGMEIDMRQGGALLDIGNGGTYRSIEAFFGTLTRNSDTLTGGIGKDTCDGNGGDDQLYGRAGFDDLDGANGNDFIEGGTGIDVLKGGGGADTFYFADEFQDADKIRDFDGSEGDRIQLSGAGFGITGPLSATDFQTSLDNVAQTPGTRLIFETDTATLWFDVDGDGFELPIAIARLQRSAVLGVSDFVIA